jgi:uncharacterized membrane protein YcaP (DUF421 family)
MVAGWSVVMDQQAFGLLLHDLFVPGTGIVEKIVRPVAVYIFLVLMLRIGGRRELAQMNGFDLVVLLVLSNAVQNAIIGEDNSLIGGFLGGGTLILLNLGVNRYLYRHRALARRLDGGPTVLVRDGQVLREHLQQERITEDELMAMIRREGVRHVGECAEVLLETSGGISVLPKKPPSQELDPHELMARLDRIERLLAGSRPVVQPNAQTGTTAP